MAQLEHIDGTHDSRVPRSQQQIVTATHVTIRRSTSYPVSACSNRPLMPSHNSLYTYNMDAGLLATNMAVRQLLVLTFSVLFAPKPIIFATPTASPLLIGQLWTTGHGPVIRTEAISVLTFGERPFAHSHGAVVIQKLLTASGLVDQGYVESALSTTTLTFAMVVKKNSIIKPALPT